ncbi:hypothetical protein ACQ4PT_063074 [Festuca glaucescens]
MGRRSSGGGFRSAPRAKTPAPNPATKAPAPAPAAQGSAPSSIIGTVGSAIADGIGWGVGTSMAHRAIYSVLGPRTIRVVEGNEGQANPAATAPAPLDACNIHNKAFGDAVHLPEREQHQQVPVLPRLAQPVPPRRSIHHCLEPD